MLTDDQECFERANLLGHFARRSNVLVQSPHNRAFADTGLGHNYRMHPLAITMSRARFHRRDELIRMRHDRFQLLNRWLSDDPILCPPVTRTGATRGAWQGYCASYCGSADSVPLQTYVAALQAEGLEVCAGGYQPLLCGAKIFQQCSASTNTTGSSDGAAASLMYPNASRHVARLIGFPLFLDEDLELVESYGRACKKVSANFRDLREYTELD